MSGRAHYKSGILLVDPLLSDEFCRRHDDHEIQGVVFESVGRVGVFCDRPVILFSFLAHTDEGGQPCYGCVFVRGFALRRGVCNAVGCDSPDRDAIKRDILCCIFGTSRNDTKNNEGLESFFMVEGNGFADRRNSNHSNYGKSAYAGYATSFSMDQSF